MLLSGIVEERDARSHSPFKGVAGKQTFFEKPENEKDQYRDDMSLKDDRSMRGFNFNEEPYVPVAVAKRHINLMEQDMRRMKDNYGKTMKDLESGYMRLEEKSRERYKRTLSAWRNKAKNKIKQFQDALKKAISERDEIETTLKERLRKLRIEKERLEKEKIFLLTENQDRKEEIEANMVILDDIKNTYQIEMKDKDEAIDQREDQIEKLKDDYEESKAKLEEEKASILAEAKAKEDSLKVQLDEETELRKEYESKLIYVPGGNRILDDVNTSLEKKKTLRERPEGEGEDEKLAELKAGEGDDESEIRSLSPKKSERRESVKKVVMAPVGALNLSSSPPESKDLVLKIEELENEILKMHQEKMTLAKSVKDIDADLSEAKKQLKIKDQQLADADKQGANIIPVEKAEKNIKNELKKSKTKKGKALDDEEEERPAFADDREVRKMVEELGKPTNCQIRIDSNIFEHF